MLAAPNERCFACVCVCVCVCAFRMHVGAWLLLQDLLTDEPFSKKDDVIIIQDPANPALRDVNQFHFVKNNERLEVFTALSALHKG